MGQLIKVTTEPIQVIRFARNARLVSSDHIDIERRKAVAQHYAFTSRHRVVGSSTDIEYINKINNAFSSKASPAHEPQPASSHMPAVPKTRDTIPLTQMQDASSASVSVRDMQAAYTMQRGSLELRAAKGDLSFIPPLVMTIITQYPSIHFEYTGGFHYVPSRDSGSSNINLSI